MVATLIADILYTLSTPASGSGARNDGRGPPPVLLRPRSQAARAPSAAGRERLGARCSVRTDSPRAGPPARPLQTFIVGIVILLWWIVCAIFGSSFVAFNAPRRTISEQPLAAFGRALVRHRPARPRTYSAAVIVGSRDILEIAPLATLLGTVIGTTIGLAPGYFRGLFDMIVGRLVDAVLSLPIVIVALLFVVASARARSRSSW